MDRCTYRDVAWYGFDNRSDSALARYSAVILSADGEVALIERDRDGHHYYVFPGGSSFPGESPAEAMLREVKEELGVDVIPGHLMPMVLRRFQAFSGFEFPSLASRRAVL